jgi:excisionase family DNA binding protein
VLETARMLSMGEDSVRRRIARRELKSERVGRQLRVLQHDLDDYLNRIYSRRNYGDAA